MNNEQLNKVFCSFLSRITIDDINAIHNAISNCITCESNYSESTMIRLRNELEHSIYVSITRMGSFDKQLIEDVIRKQLRRVKP